jgi:hypothetical protein
LPAVVLACPRVSPEWEAAALRALIKPQHGGAIRHRRGEQRWPAGATAVVREVARVCAERLGFEPVIHLPDEGDFLLAASIPAGSAEEGKAMALMLSQRLPELWFVYGRLIVHGGRFLRRRKRGGYKLQLVPASDVHVRRDVRGALRGEI